LRLEHAVFFAEKGDHNADNVLLVFSVDGN